jgi:signal transduction histidine kinase
MKITAGFGLMLILGLLIMVINKRFNRFVNEDSAWLRDSEEILKQSAELQKDLTGMENGLNGYLLLDNERYLQSYYAGAGQFDVLYEANPGLIATRDETQRKHYQRIGDIVKEWKYSVAVPLIQDRKASQDSRQAQSASLKLSRIAMQDKFSKLSLDDARQQFKLFDQQEYNLREQMRQDLNLSLYKSGTLSEILGFFILLIGIGIMVFVTRHISHRINGMIGLAEKISGGDFNMQIRDNRHDEMSRLAGSLNKMNSVLKTSFQRLEHSNLELARANNDLERFTYLASHDLKEPVRMVSIYAQMLEERYQDRLDNEGREFIRFAVEGSHRIINLLNDLLEYVRLTQAVVHCQNVDTKMALGKVLEGMEGMIDSLDAHIVADELPQVWADDTQLVKLFRNLLENALKFRGEKSPEIRIHAEKIVDEWVFSVSDNGIGIDREYAERIFVIFQRLHVREDYSGNGVGLTICKKIVELHGGRIWFDSRPGEGTTFYFSLPAVSGDRAPENKDLDSVPG